ncbi:hypothetical protein TNCT_558101 [Trichonephila clavata]|uniref:Uncharacterized protein n=1 Tax=Trichonephila clavata TaxID=2740835 RepID=A0A8X6GWX1_TRICU|nr:hypothetical protein TNCT_558101 [Trichonephila clavata]
MGIKCLRTSVAHYQDLTKSTQLVLTFICRVNMGRGPGMPPVTWRAMSCHLSRALSRHFFRQEASVVGLSQHLDAVQNSSPLPAVNTKIIRPWKLFKRKLPSKPTR